MVFSPVSYQLCRIFTDSYNNYCIYFIKIKPKKIKAHRRFLFYDQLLLIILSIWPSKGKGIFERLFKYKTPNFILNTTMLLTYATIFLVLMSLGIALTRLKVFSLKESIIGSIARLFFGPIIGYFIIKTFDLNGYSAGIILIQSAMPSAVLTYLVGSMYSPKKVVDEIASMIVVTTILSFITVPIVVFFSLKYFI